MADTEHYVLLDARGLVLHGFYKGADPDGDLDEKGKVVNSPAWGMEQLLKEYPIFDMIPPRRIIAVWDGGNRYRTELWPSYKAKRRARDAAMPVAQKTARAEWEQIARQFFAALGVTQAYVKDVEADDLIGYLCSKLPNSVVYTIDHDLVQLVADYPGTKIVIKNEIQETGPAGIPANLTRLHKSIVGDSSDEYPGVKGMGPVAFLALRQAFGDDGLEALDRIVKYQEWRALEEANSVAENAQLATLLEHCEEWALQYMLASVAPQLCEGVKYGSITKINWSRRVPSSAELGILEREIGMQGLLARFKKWLPSYTLADCTPEGKQVLHHFRDHVQDGPICAMDYESYDTLKHKPFQEAVSQKTREYVDVLSQKVTGVSFCYGDNYQHTFYMPCDHVETANFSPSNVAWAVNLAAQSRPLVIQNALFEAAVSAMNFGLELPTPWDTRLMASHVDENEELGLKHLSKHYLDYTQATYKETLEAAGVSAMNEAPAKKIVGYGCDDSIVAAHLFDLFYLIQRLEGTWEFTRDKEFSFVHEQVRGFLSGVTLDVDLVKQLDQEATEIFETSLGVVKASLTEHCLNENEAGATTLFTDLEPYEKAKLAAAGKSDEEIEAKLDDLWDRLVQGSKYVPLQKVVLESTVEWKPTPKKLSEVSAKLGLPVIEKDTKRYINEWCSKTDDDFKEASAYGGVTEQQATFLALLGQAAHVLKKREGEEYSALVSFCREVLGEPVEKSEMVGDELNFRSPPQMQNLLYGKLALPIRVRTKVKPGTGRHKHKMLGSPSTDDEAIAYALAEDVDHSDWRYEVLINLDRARKAAHAQSLFYRPLPMWVHPLDNRIHPQITNCGTVTRRPSGSSPNVLQLSKKNDGVLRKAILPFDQNHVIVKADFNGQEIRIMTSESKDPTLLDAYIGPVRKDVHSLTASEIAPTFFRQYTFREKFGLPDVYDTIAVVSYEDYIDARKDPDLKAPMNYIRDAAKAVNFLISYLGGYTTLAMRLLIKQDLAKQLMNVIFARYGRLQPWQQEVIEFARIHGYTQTAYGNRRHASADLLSSDREISTRMERQLVNATIQGCAADILKEVMHAAWETKLFEETGAYLIAPVYDELVSSVPRAALWEYCARLKEIMEVTPPGHAVPMVAEFSVSALSWGHCVEIGADITEDKVFQALEDSLKKVA